MDVITNEDLVLHETIWHKLAEKDLYKMLKELRYTDEMFIKYQKNRFTKSILFLLVGIILAFIQPYLIIAGIALALIQWTSEYKRVKRFYNNSIFQKQLTFSKFTRMLIPYLLQSNATLYNVITNEDLVLHETIWHKLAEKDLYKMLKELRYTDEMFIKYQKNRFTKSILFLVAGIILAFIQPYLIIAGIVLALFQCTNEYKRVKRFYNNSLFQKQLTFSKFTRMLIPYLLQSNATLYNVFNKMLFRLEEGYVKSSLENLIIEMNDNPNSEEPFKKFALMASGTDQAVLFMTTLYDYQQNNIF